MQGTLDSISGRLQPGSMPMGMGPDSELAQLKKDVKTLKTMLVKLNYANQCSEQDVSEDAPHARFLAISVASRFEIVESKKSKKSESSSSSDSSSSSSESDVPTPTTRKIRRAVRETLTQVVDRRGF
eukprot:568837-Prorocentrum_minimum.AAC.2